MLGEENQGLDVPAGNPYILLSANWPNAAQGNVPFQIVAPDGTVYTNADLGGPTIAEVPDLSGSTALTIAVDAPAAGNWTMELPGSANLGTTQFTEYGPTPATSIVVNTPSTLVQGGSVSIAYTATDRNPGAQVSLFYSTRPSGFEGTLIASGLSAGKKDYVWNTASMPAGTYYIYALVADNVATPSLAYASGAVNVAGASPALSTSGAAAYYTAGASAVLLDPDVTVSSLAPI